MPIGDRLPWHKRKRRLVRSGDRFTSDELDRDEIELELPPPFPDPGEEEREPWGWGGKVMPPDVAARLKLYREFVRSREGGS